MKNILIPVVLSALMAFGGYAIHKASNSSCGVKCACAPCNCNK